jgi:hypothetical protein
MDTRFYYTDRYGDYQGTLSDVIALELNVKNE